MMELVGGGGGGGGDRAREEEEEEGGWETEGAEAPARPPAARAHEKPEGPVAGGEAEAGSASSPPVLDTLPPARVE